MTTERSSTTGAGKPTAGPSHHSYTKDRGQLLRRLSRMEGQVRGVALADQMRGEIAAEPPCATCRVFLDTVADSPQDFVFSGCDGGCGTWSQVAPLTDG